MNWFASTFLKISIAAISTALVVGCESDGTYDGDNGNDDRYEDGDRTVAGGRIPSDAHEVKSGDDVLKYRAPEDGRVFLYDANDRKVIDSRAIGAGREYIVSPKDDRAWIDDDRVLDYDFERGHEHRVYFLSDDEQQDRDDDRNTKPDPDSSSDGRFDGTTSTVPKSASIAKEGRGDLSFVAAGAGTVYVYDVKDQKVVTTYRLKKGQRFTISPKTDEGAVDGKRVFKKDLNEKSTYRLYFDLNV